jgi:poly(A) polymerase
LRIIKSLVIFKCRYACDQIISISLKLSPLSYTLRNAYYKNLLRHSPSALIFAAMFIQCSPKELFIFKKIASAAAELQVPCFIIGGFVRDKIIGRPTKDIDVVCLGNGIALAEKVAQRFSPTPTVNIFKTYGTAQIKTDDIELEFVGARKESYNLNSRNPLVEPGTLEDDQNRRDFTINALAISLNEGTYGNLIDPFNGLQHIKEGILQTPLLPAQTFIDDPLRMMRGIRFAAQLNYSLAPETLQAIKDNAARIKIITGERIADELNKILMSAVPSIGFDLLYKTGLLQIIFPQMVALAGAEYIDGKGHKDNFYHTLQVVDNIAKHTDDIWLRWAAVLHDIAKPNTKKFEEGHGWTFHGHEVVGGRMVPKIFTQLKLPQNEKMKFVRKMVELHLRPISLTKENITDSAIRRLLFDAGEDFEALMKLCKADITSKNKFKVQRYLDNFDMVEKRCAEVEESDQLRNWQPPISGELIMQTFNLPQGREVGIIKNAIREAILDGVIPNNFEAAHGFMLSTAKDLGINK